MQGSKCELFRQEVTFLGHSVPTSSEIKPSPDKSQSCKQLETITNSYVGAFIPWICVIIDVTLNISL